MLFQTLAASALLSGAALAAPVYPNVPVTFNAAAGVSYTVVVVANNVAVPTYNDLSITSISMEGRASFVCTAYGIDGSVTQLVANQVRHKHDKFFFFRRLHGPFQESSPTNTM
jgi:hypothetical protein